MKTTVSKYDFERAFVDAGRKDQFTYEAIGLLFDYFEDYEDSTGEEIELDVVAICCDYSEDTVTDIARNYLIDLTDDECASIPVQFTPPRASASIPVQFTPLRDNASIPVQFTPPRDNASIPVQFTPALLNASIPVQFTPPRDNASIPVQFTPDFDNASIPVQLLQPDSGPRRPSH